MPEEDSSRTPPREVRGLRRLLYVALGLFFVGMAWVGIVLPGVPATPFLLLASYFFVRSSPRLHRWLHRSPVFGKLLHDWETQRGIRRPVKITASVMVVTAVSLSIALTNLPVWVKCVIGGMACVGLVVIWSVRTATGSSAGRLLDPPVPPGTPLAVAEEPPREGREQHRAGQ